MSLFLEDAERLLRDNGYALNSALADERHCEEMVKRNPSDDNKTWLRNARLKVSIMANVVSELQGLIEITTEEEKMMNEPSNQK